MTVTITIGRGLREPQGQRVQLVGKKAADALAQELARHAGTAAWWSTHSWAGDHRMKKNWESSIGVGVDLDYYATDGGHCSPPPEARGLIAERLRTLPGTLAHATPRGVRVIFLFASPVVEFQIFRQAALGAAVEIESVLRETGLLGEMQSGVVKAAGLIVDRGALLDRARMLWTPGAHIPGEPEPRSAEVVLLDGGRVFEAPEMASLAPFMAPSVATPTASALDSQAGDSGQRWAAAGLLLAASELADTAEGGRNYALNGAAFRFGRMVAGGLLNRPTVESELLAAALDAGLPETEAKRTLQSGLDAGEAADSIRGPQEEMPLAGCRTDLPAQAAAAFEARDQDCPPDIRIGVDEDRVVRQAIDALASDPDLFQRAGLLCRVTCEPRNLKHPLIHRDADAPRIEPVPVPWVQVKLARAGRWTRFDRKEQRWVEAHPPTFAIQAVATAGTWRSIRPLLGVIETPTLRRDGTAVSVPGYDATTGLFLQPIGAVGPIPLKPTKADALVALDRLLGVVADFPFEKKEHQSAWLAAVLTPLCRWAFDGPAPLFLFDATVRGSGKTLLAKATGLIALGRKPSATIWPADEEERRKRITATALAGDPLVLIDNVEGVLGGAALNAALTTTSWDDRILGVSKNSGALPLYTVWLATGNNAVLGADTARRTLQIRLASEMEKPEERTDFSHPDLLDWIKDHRPGLVADALTLCLAYFAAGKPEQPLTAMGSFEGWSLIRQILVWLGLPDPLKTQLALAEASDLDGAKFRGLVAGLEELAPGGEWVTTAEVFRRIEANGAKPCLLRDVLLEHCPGRGGIIPDAKRLGFELRHYIGRISGAKAIQTEPGRVAKWRVAPCGRSGVVGSSTPIAGAIARESGPTEGGSSASSASSAEAPPCREPGEDEDELNPGNSEVSGLPTAGRNG